MTNAHIAITEDVIRSIAGGFSVAVRRNSGEGRVIQILAGKGKVVGAIDVEPEIYERVMQCVVARLAELHGSTLKVTIASDFYGNHWASVRSGLLGWRVSRVVMSPRHLNALEHAISLGEGVAPHLQPRAT